MSSLTFRNRLGELVDIESVPATKIKNQFSSFVDQAVRGKPVAITWHETTKAVLISLEEFESLVVERSRRLDTLTGQFDGLLAGMQKPAAKKGMEDAFNASPQMLGRAAVKAALK